MACKVENGILVASSGAESCMVGKPKRGVVREARVLPALPGDRIGPPQVVLTSPKLLLLDPGSSARRHQALKLRANRVRITKSVVTRMQPDLVPPVADLAQQVENPGVVQAIVAVDRPARVTGHEVEGALHAERFALAHQQIERVVEVVPGWHLPTERGRREPTQRDEWRMLSPEVPTGETPCLGKRDSAQRQVDVVSQPQRRLAPAPPQPRPQPREQGPEQLDILVDKRPVEQTLFVSERTGGREAILAVSGYGSELLITAEQKESGAEHVDPEPHLQFAGHERLTITVQHRKRLGHRQRLSTDLVQVRARQRTTRKRRLGQPVVLRRGEQHISYMKPRARRIASEGDLDVPAIVENQLCGETKELRHDNLVDVAALRQIAGRMPEDERRSQTITRYAADRYPCACGDDRRAAAGSSVAPRRSVPSTQAQALHRRV